MRIALAAAHTEARATAEWLSGEGPRPVGFLALSAELLAARSSGWDPSVTADDAGVVLHRTTDINDLSTVAWLQALNLDALIVLGWSQILRSEVLGVAEWIVGSHASPLPRGRGGSPVNWAILNRERSWGNTLMRLSPKLDGGDIIGQSIFPIDDTDTVATAYGRVEASNLELIKVWLSDLAVGRASAMPQEETTEPVLRRRCPDDGIIDWTQGSVDIDALVRAVTHPYPGARTVLNGVPLCIWSTTVVSPEDVGDSAGLIESVVVAEGEIAITVQCGRGRLCIRSMTITSGDPVPASVIREGLQFG